MDPSPSQPILTETDVIDLMPSQTPHGELDTGSDISAPISQPETISNAHRDSTRKRSHTDSDEENSIPATCTNRRDERTVYIQKYEQQYSWLYYSHILGGFKCKICETFADVTKNTQYVTASVSLGTHPTRQLSKHEDSETHKKAVEKRYCSMNPKKRVQSLHG